MVKLSEVPLLITLNTVWQSMVPLDEALKMPASVTAAALLGVFAGKVAT
jgi:hypothetical protein